MDYISFGEGNKNLVVVKSIAAVVTNGKTRLRIMVTGAEAINVSYDTEAERDAVMETIREVIGNTK